MALTETQQSFELIKKSRSILIVFKPDWTGDDLSSALALSNIIKKIGRRVEVAGDGFNYPAGFDFLGLSEIKNSIGELQKFVIGIDTSKTKVGEFFYDHDQDKLNIYLSPLNGQFKLDDVSISTSDYDYDLILIIGSPDLEALGKIFADHQEFFYTTPKINLDNSGKNERFGDLNLVNIASSSIAEMIYQIVKDYDGDLFDADIATCLLSGLISATKNFKTADVTPITLRVASELIALGARREQIIQNLYQTRFLSTLKLWGRVLTRLNNDLDDKLVWSVISNQDFLETSTAPEELTEVIDELIVSMPKIEIIALIYEDQKSQNVKCLLHVVKNIDSLLICQKYNPTGNSTLAKFELNDVSLAVAEREIIGEIKSKLKQS